VRGWTAAAIAATVVATLAGLCAPAARAEVDSGVIRLSESAAPAEPEPDAPEARALRAGARHSFDVEAFDSRFESLWFQRKAYQAEGRDDDAAHQSDLIRDFVAEEGVRRLPIAAGALVMEARGWLREGSYEKALASLSLAESLDPGRPQIALARAHVLWASGAGTLATGAELALAVRNTLTAALSDLNTLHGLALVSLVAVLGCVALFSVFMAVRYQLVMRHDIEEWLIGEDREALAKAAGWLALFLPFVVIAGAGWFALYWIGIFFRYMRRAERALAVALLLLTALAVPMYRFSVGLYGLAADPTVRTTIAAANGGYDPDRIVKMRALVTAQPDDPIYRFLLAGLYKNGRYFEDAFLEYRQVLEAAPATYQARINLGNIYFALGQYGEAIANYRKAIEIRPDCALAYYDMYLAQSDTFKLKEATESLAKAREIDAEETSRLLESGSRDGGSPKVIDATVAFDSIWKATVEGRHLSDWLSSTSREGRDWTGALSQLANATSVLALLTLAGCGVMPFMLRARIPAQRCLRCGRPFCSQCKSSRDGYEYCSQCVHLFVLGDGLAPETKSMKLYEVERHEKRSRRGRRLAALIVPGASHVLSGRAWVGSGLIVLWLIALLAGYPEILAPVERAFGVGLHLSELRAGAAPAVYGLDAVFLLAVPLGVVVWLAGNLGARRLRGA